MGTVCRGRCGRRLARLSGRGSRSSEAVLVGRARERVLFQVACGSLPGRFQLRHQTARGNLTNKMRIVTGISGESLVTLFECILGLFPPPPVHSCFALCTSLVGHSRRRDILSIATSFVCAYMTTWVWELSLSVVFGTSSRGICGNSVWTSKVNYSATCNGIP